MQWNRDQEGICVANWDVPCQRENGHWQPWAQCGVEIWTPFGLISSQVKGKEDNEISPIYPVLYLLNQRWKATTRPVCGWRIWIVFLHLAKETSVLLWQWMMPVDQFSVSWSQPLGLHPILQRLNYLQLLNLVWVTVTIRNNQLFHFSMDNLRLYLLLNFPIISDVVFLSHSLISSVSFLN